MPTASQPNTPGFVRTFVFPALWIFVIPILGGAFFLHARSTYNKQFREAWLRGAMSSPDLTPEEKEAVKANVDKVSIGRVMSDPVLREMVPKQTQFDYRTFQWMTLISFGSIALAILSLITVGICVMLSFRSQSVQYYSLAIAWQLLRIVGVIQTVAQGTLLVALSFWVTALWFNVYIVKLIFLVGIIVLVAVFSLIKAFFKRVNTELTVQGVQIEERRAAKLWERLKTICQTLGTQPPNNLIAGIDDNFFVTEQRIIVRDKPVHGRTLFVSLPLLKQLSGPEADAVLAHEMAHFSGNDTLYSQKISPLLLKYDQYLEALRSSSAFPVYLWMNLFRALFELSLGKLNRQREYRADKIAAEQTSPADLGAAILKTVAYSCYRTEVQVNLFNKQSVLEDVDIGNEVEGGYASFSSRFFEKNDFRDLQISHPFDSHPTIASRLENLGLTLQQSEAAQLLSRPSDGKWYYEIDLSEELERAQWDDFEASFREIHEQSLPYRFLPSNDQEREVVVKAFPELQFTEKKGTLTVDYEKVTHTNWESPIYFRDISDCAINERTLLIWYFKDGTKKKQSINSGKYAKQAADVINAVTSYYQRYGAAAAFQLHLAQVGQQK